MLEEHFKHYLKVSGERSDKSIRHYVTGINTISTILRENGYPDADVFSVTSKEELDGIKEFLDTNEEFITKDTVGHRMYSVAFNHFYRFTCEDKSFFTEGIERLDIPVAVSPREKIVHYQWKRNQILISQAIEGANYMCENNGEHNTFTAKATGMPYMEGHHLIPLEFQPLFQTSLDVYANIVCLCPACHRLLHFGVNSERLRVAEKLFDRRKARLAKCGIELEKNGFIELVT